MKTTRFLPLLLLFALPCLLGAQDHLGSWSMPATAPDGTAITNTVTFKADGTMTVDFASDGTIEVNANYTAANGVITIDDTTAESPCYGKTGKYQVSIVGNKMTAKVISDPCPERKGDGSPMVMTRK